VRRAFIKEKQDETIFAQFSRLQCRGTPVPINAKIGGVATPLAAGECPSPRRERNSRRLFATTSATGLSAEFLMQEPACGDPHAAMPLIARKQDPASIR